MSRPARLSRRQRQALLTALLLFAAALVTSAVLFRQYRSNTAAVYKPGEENADITSTLARRLPPEAPRPA